MGFFVIINFDCRHFNFSVEVSESQLLPVSAKESESSAKQAFPLGCSAGEARRASPAGKPRQQ
jgi:hypothetical protein